MNVELPIAVDAMGGDLGSSVAVEGAVRAAREFNVSSILVGKEDELRSKLTELKADNDPRISTVHAKDVVTMEDSASAAIRRKPQSSIRIAYNLVKEGRASAVVSPGNTGAVMAAGIFVLGIFPGVVRPAIASLIPKIGTASPTVLLDSGANIECRATQLVQFALMGKLYAQIATGCQDPRIALLSNGSESSKGTDVIRAAAQALSSMKDLRYVGYIEGRDMPKDAADVVVCDGFVGNVMLKAMEGTVELVLQSLKFYMKKSLRWQLGMYLAKPLFKTLFREKFDPAAYGGAPLLGLKGISIICHGSSNDRAIMNAILVADKFVKEGLVKRMEAALASFDLDGANFDDTMWSGAGTRFENTEAAEAPGAKKDISENGA